MPEITAEQGSEQQEELRRIRHSCAHILAQAVVELFPTAKMGWGPPTEDGFYYDFELPRSLTPEDLASIEEGMKRIVKGNFPFERSTMRAEEAVSYFEERDQPFKVETIRELPEEGLENGEVSFYTQDAFTDLCKGPHVRRTGEVRAFKLLDVSGAYWRGSEKRPMLQRIKGTAWKTRADLDIYLEKQAAARARDHRKLGKELQLFALAPEIGPGLPLWLPRGATIRRVLERYIVDRELEAGYQHVYTPVLGKLDLYRQSGHLDHYRETMFPPIQLDNEELQLRPMNCPHHAAIYSSSMRSYRDLPLRIAELGTMFRYERSGAVEGLSRVRMMTLNDAHIFCTPDQIKSEISNAMQLIRNTYADLGLTDYWYRLSLRDPADTEKYHQDNAMWELAERVLREALDEQGMNYRAVEGEAAFYGPKLDVQIPDVSGKDETVSTIQVDFLLGNKFGLEYVGADGAPHRPVVIHHGIIGTMERMVSFLIESFGGAFPVWFSPVQAVALPIADRHAAYAAEVRDALKEQGLRAELDDRNEKLNFRIREAQLQKIPYMLVMGDREQEDRTVTIRLRTGENLPTTPLSQAVEFIAFKDATRSHELKPCRPPAEGGTA